MDGIRLVEGFAKLEEARAERLEGEEWTARVCWRRYFRAAWQANMKADRFIAWQTAPAPDDMRGTDTVVFVWAMGTGCWSSFPQPTGEFVVYLNGARVIAFHDTPNSRCWSRDDIAFYYEVKRREGQSSFGLGYLRVPASMLASSAPAVIKVVPGDSDSERWFTLCEYGEGNLATGVSFSELNAAATFVDEGVAAVLRGPQRRVDDGLTLYWGDLHVHSSMANYIQATPEENFEYGRHVAQLDFIAITDQDHFLDERQFARVIDNANRHNAPGAFAAFIGYEWSSRLYGHRNVIFRGDSGVLIRRHDIEKPYEPPYPLEKRDSFACLCGGLKASGVPCMLLPHHPSMTSMGALDWAVFDPELECAVEIYSLWGNSEHAGAPGRSLCNDQRAGSYVQDALARGYHLGIIAAGETGDGHPGNAQWRRNYARKAGLPLNPLGGGLAAVWARELTRESIFDAIKAGRCYGTTSARIALKFTANGQWMSERISVTAEQLSRGLPVNLRVEVTGTDRIEGISVFRNGRIVGYAPGYADEMRYDLTDHLYEDDCFGAKGQRFAYYYVRIQQQDGHLAWSSPVWFGEDTWC